MTRFFGVGFAIAFLTLAVAAWMSQQSERTIQHVSLQLEQSNFLRFHLKDLRVSLVELEKAILDRNKAEAEMKRQESTQILNRITEFASQEYGSKTIKANIQNIKNVIEKRIQLLSDEGNVSAQRKSKNLEVFRHQIQAFEAIESKEMEGLIHALRDQYSTKISFNMIVILVGLLFLTLGFFLMRAYLKEREEVVRLAQEASRQKSDFLANMSHEIRTPLNGIFGLLDHVLSTTLTLEQKDSLLAIESASKNLLQIVSDILDFSKIESGKIDLDNVEFDLGSLVRDAERTFRMAAQSKGLDLSYSIPTQVEGRYKGDPFRITQVLNNLLSNAIKFTTKGSVFIKVSLLEESRGAIRSTRNIRIEVRDTGIGIADAQQNKLFEKFTQVDSSTTRKFGGSGLGLSICKKIVTLLGGTIGVQSALNQGASFWFEIPLELSSESSLKEPVSGVPLKRLKTSRPRKILIAEDNQLNQRVAQVLLEQMGHQVKIVNNGRQAIQSLMDERFDLILMDCHMPECDGYQATKEIRNNLRSPIPIIAVTANALHGEREKCLDVGMNEFITKPIDAVELYNKIEERMEKRSIDPNAFNEITSADPENSQTLINELIEIFIRTVPLKIKEMQECLKQKEFHKISEIAHSLKSSAAYVGANKLREMALTIEKGGMDSEMLERRLNSFEREYERVQEDLLYFSKNTDKEESQCG